MRWRERAREIIDGLPTPLFYRVFPRQRSASLDMLRSDPLIQKVKNQVYPLLENDFGHGILHSERVSVDAGSIIQVEMAASEKKGVSDEKILQQMQWAQIAGLLHDVKRKEENHAVQGAKFARHLLGTAPFNFTPATIDIITTAISQHEAFQIIPPRDFPASLISNALYDADKFRWGPDNFTHTVWDMVIFANLPPGEFLKKFPTGLDKLAQIRSTFRTDTGKVYGPDFINIGMAAGRRLFREIQAPRDARVKGIATQK